MENTHSESPMTTKRVREQFTLAMVLWAILAGVCVLAANVIAAGVLVDTI